jgi:hypothetical protein
MIFCALARLVAAALAAAEEADVVAELTEEVAI